MECITSFDCLKRISLIFLLFLFSCNEDNKTTDPASFDISGIWIISEEITGNCEGSTYPEFVRDVFEVTQVGNNITMVQSSSGQELTGTISGSRIVWSGVLEENSGANTISFIGNVLNNGDSIAGNANWTYSKDTYNCSGTAKVTAFKSGNISVNFTGIWKGTWSSNENDITGDFIADITQTDNSLTGTIDVLDIGLVGAELTGSVAGSFFTFGDIDKMIEFTGIIGTDTMKASGNYKYDAMADNGTWQATKTLKPETVEWSVKELTIVLVDQKNMLISDIRNDGIKRIYTSDGDQGDGKIHEFSYVTGIWQELVFGEGGEEYIMVNALGCGNGQNDTQNRLYACGNGLYEHSFANGSWELEDLGAEYGWMDDIALGSARNDDTTRIYTGLWDGISEFTYINGVWRQDQINTEDRGIDQILICDGRNDDVLRLYAAADDDLLEYTFTGGDWTLSDLINTDAVDIEEMVSGFGRNDGKNRIYIAANGGVVELDYSEGDWNVIPIGEVSYSSHIAVGDGRNDGTNRVYVANDQESLTEFSFLGSWLESSELQTGVNIQSIAVGSAQGDGHRRVYASGNNRIYEYEAK